MSSNVINLSIELASRKDHRALTEKQKLTIELRNHYIQEARLRRSVAAHKVAYKQRLIEYVEVAEWIERKEERLLDV
jgi:hypothetical protein